jgi:hypothetical protein
MHRAPTQGGVGRSAARQDAGASRCERLDPTENIRIRRRAMRYFDWIPDGPIRGYFTKQGMPDFLKGPFEPDDESLDFAHGMLTRAAQAELKLELRRLRAKLVSLHEQSIPAPLTEKDGIGLLLAIRQWEPLAFRRLRRTSHGT